MTNLRADEIHVVFFRNLAKIGTDENKAIYSISCNQALESLCLQIDVMPTLNKTSLTLYLYGSRGSYTAKPVLATTSI